MLNDESELCVYIQGEKRYLTAIQQINTPMKFIPIYHREHKALLQRIFSSDKVKVAHSYLNEAIPDFFNVFTVQL